MEHTWAQESAWTGLCETVKGEIKGDYTVDGRIPHQLKISRPLEPIREVILNFAGEDLFIHYEENGPRSLPRAVRVSEDGTLLELRSNSPISAGDIACQVRKHLAGMKQREPVVFSFRKSPEGGYEAQAVGHSIFTQSETMEELKRNATDAVRCHFVDTKILPEILFVEEPPKQRIFGSAKGEFTVPDDFNDPLPKDIEDVFYK